MSKGTDRVDLIFRALASRPRRAILRLLASGEAAEDARCCGTGQVCACVFSERLGVGAPTISHHMKLLVDAGLVDSHKRGQWVYYRLRPDGLAPVLTELGGLACTASPAALASATVPDGGRDRRPACC